MVEMSFNINECTLKDLNIYSNLIFTFVCIVYSMLHFINNKFKYIIFKLLIFLGGIINDCI